MTTHSAIHLHGFFRSSASWRVRIALALKGLSYSQHTYKLRAQEQRSASYLAMNPQGLVPTLEMDGAVLTQSLAIIEYLDETHPAPPLIGITALERARVRAFALAIACDIHPVQNLKILARLQAMGHSEDEAHGWARDFTALGLDACDKLLAQSQGPYCFGARPSLADICLIPQLANARRFGVDLKWQRLLDVEAHCLAQPAFRETAPDRQPDFVA